VEPCSKSIPIIESVLKSHSIPFLKGNTWTTDAIFRETKEKIKLRREIDSCLTVEMEASALFAVAKFRKVHLGQILYAGDDVSGEEWDNRDWLNIKSVREKLILVSKEIVKELKNDIENK
jgi:nucleoside phosphorylase